MIIDLMKRMSAEIRSKEKNVCLEWISGKECLLSVDLRKMSAEWRSKENNVC